MSVHVYTNAQRIEFSGSHAQIYSSLSGKTWHVEFYKAGRFIDSRRRGSKESAAKAAQHMASVWMNGGQSKASDKPGTDFGKGKQP